jgi:hypothetical protein
MAILLGSPMAPNQNHGRAGATSCKIPPPPEKRRRIVARASVPGTGVLLAFSILTLPG